jgi:hypothetical protein
MKALFFISGLCFLLSKTAIAQKNDSAESRFEILRIDSVQSVYVIYAKRHDSTIKIVSKKESLNNCEPILKGMFYQLAVESLLKYSASKRHIGGVKYNGILIKLEGGNVIWDLFTSEDLKGLCYASQATTGCKRKQKKSTIAIHSQQRLLTKPSVGRY